MSGGGKGGSQTTQVTLPPHIEEASKRAIQRGEDIAKMGFMPYNGPSVAAFTPQQQAAMNGTQQAAGAFGMQQANPVSGMPQAQTFAGGVQGHSAAPIRRDMVQQLRANRPGQMALYDSFFNDPVSGDAPPPQQTVEDIVNEVLGEQDAPQNQKRPGQRR